MFRLKWRDTPSAHPQVPHLWVPAQAAPWASLPGMRWAELCLGSCQAGGRCTRALGRRGRLLGASVLVLGHIGVLHGPQCLSGCRAAPGPTSCPSAPLSAVGPQQLVPRAGSAHWQPLNSPPFSSQRPHPHAHPHGRGPAPGPAAGHPGHPTSCHPWVSAHSLGGGLPSWLAPSPSGQVLWPLHPQAWKRGWGP